MNCIKTLLAISLFISSTTAQACGVDCKSCTTQTECDADLNCYFIVDSGLVGQCRRANTCESDCALCIDEAACATGAGGLCLWNPASGIPQQCFGTTCNTNCDLCSPSNGECEASRAPPAGCAPNDAGEICLPNKEASNPPTRSPITVSPMPTLEPQTPMPTMAQTPKPTSLTPRPTSIKTPRPSYDTPKPSYVTPKPSYKTPKPSYEFETTDDSDSSSSISDSDSDSMETTDSGSDSMETTDYDMKTTDGSGSDSSESSESNSESNSESGSGSGSDSMETTGYGKDSVDSNSDSMSSESNSDSGSADSTKTPGAHSDSGSDSGSADSNMTPGTDSNSDSSESGSDEMGTDVNSNSEDSIAVDVESSDSSDAQKTKDVKVDSDDSVDVDTDSDSDSDSNSDSATEVVPVVEIDTDSGNDSGDDLAENRMRESNAGAFGGDSVFESTGSAVGVLGIVFAVFGVLLFVGIASGVWCYCKSKEKAFVSVNVIDVEDHDEDVCDEQLVMMTKVEGTRQHNITICEDDEDIL